jgi:hypothetical protein
MTVFGAGFAATSEHFRESRNPSVVVNRRIRTQSVIAHAKVSNLAHLGVAYESITRLHPRGITYPVCSHLYRSLSQKPVT